MMCFFSGRRYSHLSESQESSWHNFPLLALVYYDFFSGCICCICTPVNLHSPWRLKMYATFFTCSCRPLVVFWFQKYTTDCKCAICIRLKTPPVFHDLCPSAAAYNYHIYIFHKVKVDCVGRWNIMENSPRAQVQWVLSPHHHAIVLSQLKLNSKKDWTAAHTRDSSTNTKRNPLIDAHTMRKFFLIEIFIFARISLIFSLFTTSFTRSKLFIGLCAFSQYFYFEFSSLSLAHLNPITSCARRSFIQFSIVFH